MLTHSIFDSDVHFSLKSTFVGIKKSSEPAEGILSKQF